MSRQLGREIYVAPFEVSSVLRAYGVHVISALGDHATDALQSLARHADSRVRVTVAHELRRHEDVSALALLSGLAESDEHAEVKQAALEAVEELRQVAERIAAEQRTALPAPPEGDPPAAAPLVTAGEDAGPAPEPEDQDTDEQEEAE